MLSWPTLSGVEAHNPKTLCLSWYQTRSRDPDLAMSSSTAFSEVAAVAALSGVATLAALSGAATISAATALLAAPYSAPASLTDPIEPDASVAAPQPLAARHVAPVPASCRRPVFLQPSSSPPTPSPARNSGRPRSTRQIQIGSNLGLTSNISKYFYFTF